VTTGRAIAAFVAVGIVRTTLNALFYGFIIANQLHAMMAAHPGIFREQVGGLIVSDFIFAALFVFILAKVGRALGGGAGAGLKLGVMLALIGAVLGNLYWYYSTTFVSLPVMITEDVYHVIAGAIVGAIAGGIALRGGASAAAAA
jgi:hypothetical protein